MDLVVLISPSDPGVYSGTTPIARGSGKGKGKGKAVMPDMADWRSTRISLWRMLGSQVWEIEVKGWIGGLAWSRDGEDFPYCRIK